MYSKPPPPPPPPPPRVMAYNNIAALDFRLSPPIKSIFSAPRLIMLLVLVALLALAAPAAHAAGCTAFADFGHLDSCIGNICLSFDDLFYVMVPASNFLTGDHTIYLDETCETAVPPGFNDEGNYYPFFGGPWGPGSAFAKNGRGRKAMEICELNTDLEIAYVRHANRDLTMFDCIGGKRMGPERQRRELLYGMWKFKGNAKQALKECREFAKGWRVKYPPPRPNLAEPDPASGKWHWDCWRTWEVSDAYLKRVGA